MNQARRSLVTAAMLLLATSVPARAQDEPPPGWIMLGMGAGNANVACSGGGCSGGWTLHGPTLLMAIGLMLTPHVGIGVGLDKWRSSSDTVEANTVALLVRYYPAVRAGAFIEGGAGLSRAAVWLDDGSIPQAHGVGFMAAVGYDVRLLRVNGVDIGLIPRVSYVSSSIGDLRDSGPTFATGWRHQVLTLGLGIGLFGPRTRQ